MTEHESDNYDTRLGVNLLKAHNIQFEYLINIHYFFQT